MGGFLSTPEPELPKDIQPCLFYDSFFENPSNGFRVHYLLGGSDVATDGSISEPATANKPLYIFFHGLSNTGAGLIPYHEEFLKYANVLLPDARGHGQSQGLPAGSFTMDNLVSDGVALVKHFAPKFPYVILGGFSLGGSTAARVAKECPNLVRLLILEDPPWTNLPGQPPAPDRRRPKLFDMARGLKQKPVEEVRAMKMGGPPSIAGFSFKRDDVSYEQRLMQARYPQAEFGLIQMRQLDADTVEPTFLEADDAINTAVLDLPMAVLLQTATGPGLPFPGVQRPEITTTVLASYPNARHVDFPGAGHMIHINRTEEWRESIRKFVLEHLEKKE